LVRKKKPLTFAFEYYTPKNIMFEFQQYIGFLLFLTILTIGFWLMFFLVAFVQYWVVGALWELYKEKKAKKQQSV